MKREKRVHVINVRFHSGQYWVVLSDRTEVSWDEWVNGVRDALQR